MKTFQFRLEGLLRQRKVAEERCLSDLRVFQSALADAASRKRQLDGERERTIDSLRRLEVGDLEMEQLLRHRRYLVALENRTREVEAEMVRRRYEMRDAQAAADQAIRERQLVERLKEKRKEEYDHDLRRKETRELDEIAGGLHARGRRDSDDLGRAAELRATRTRAAQTRASQANTTQANTTQASASHSAERGGRGR